MGHTRLGDLPRTRRWGEVVGLLACGAGTSQVAVATMNAAERGLNLAAEDKALVETVWLLTQLPLAARAKDLKGFVSALRAAGVQVSDQPGVMEVVGAFTTSDFSPGAVTEAARPNAVPVALMNGEQLVALLVEYGIGVKKQTHAIIDLEGSHGLG